MRYAIAAALLLGYLCEGNVWGIAAEQPLVPFEKYFTPDRYKAVRISPNGEWIAYMAPFGGAGAKQS